MNMLGMMKSWNTLFDFPWKEILSGVLTFLYSIAHYAGMLVVYLLGRVLPAARVPTDLVDPIGYLALLTVFLVIVQVAKKLAWVIVVIGWVLILVRILIGVFGF
jgi:uncharacterized membrane protein YecN with MAPEG domain